MRLVSSWKISIRSRRHWCRGPFDCDQGCHRFVDEGDGDDDNQVFVQPMLSNVLMAGVAFTRDPNGGGPYFVINYDDRSGRTDLVTSGRAAVDQKTFCGLKSRLKSVPKPLAAGN